RPRRHRRQRRARRVSPLGLPKDHSCARWHTGVGKLVSVADAQHRERAAHRPATQPECKGRLHMNQPARSGLRRRLRPLVVVTSFIALVVTMTFSLPAFTPAHAALGAVGPLDAATNFPFWYQDARGLRLGYCFDPVFCFLGNQLPSPTQPPSVPNNFPAEMFYWDADASMPTNNGGQAFMRLGLEAAFLPGPGVVDGQQVTFGRIRFRLDNLQAGATYTITHPYGVDTFVAQTSGLRSINTTTDVGCVPK